MGRCFLGCANYYRQWRINHIEDALICQSPEMCHKRARARAGEGAVDGEVDQVCNELLGAERQAAN